MPYRRRSPDGSPPGIYELERFVQAQDAGGVYARALAELRAAHKSGHWMWFIFPQASGLGHSETSRRYAIASLSEARAYLAHPLLGARLLECARALAELRGRSAEQILGPIDAIKLRSSMTLFAHARPEEPLFRALIACYFGGRGDARTDEWAARHP